MSSSGWTTVRHGRGVPFPSDAASAFGSRRSAQGPREFSGRHGFDNAAAEAFGKKKQFHNNHPPKEHFTALPKKAVEPEVKLEISNTTLFPALGGAGAPKETIMKSSGSFADIMKARLEADKAEQEAAALEAKRAEEARAREEADLAIHRRSHHRRTNYYSGPPSMEEDYQEEDENSLDYRHPYDTSYHKEYSAPMYEEEDDYDSHDASVDEDNSAW